MNYDFDEVIERRGTNSSKWDSCKDVFGRDDIVLCGLLIRILRLHRSHRSYEKRVEHGIYGYTCRGQSTMKLSRLLKGMDGI